jgi:hypothetical protein
MIRSRGATHAHARRSAVIGALALIAVGSWSVMPHEAAAEPRWFAEDGVAIRGTDPVAYFTRSPRPHLR